MSLLTTILIAMGCVVLIGGARPLALLTKADRGEGRSRIPLYLLFAGLGICGGIFCFAAAYAASIVPIGTAAGKAADHAAKALLASRLANGVGPPAIALEVHFALRYARRSARYIGLLYVACLSAVPLVWTPWALTQRLEPVTGKSTWAKPVPWVAQMEPLVLVFAVFWVAAQVYIQIVLYRHALAMETTAPRRLMSVSMVRLGLMGTGCLVVIDTFNVAIGYTGLMVSPLALVLMVILIGAALRRERALDAETSAAGGAGNA